MKKFKTVCAAALAASMMMCMAACTSTETEGSNEVDSNITHIEDEQAPESDVVIADVEEDTSFVLNYPQDMLIV